MYAAPDVEDVRSMLTASTLSGATWTVSSRVLGRLVDFLTLMLLARALEPADFGVTALAMSLVVVVDTVMEVPLIQALTRLRIVEKIHLDTAFTLGVARGLFLSLVIVAAAWPFAAMYGDPHLLWLVPALALGPISRGLYNPNMVVFIKEMRFRQVFVAEFAGKIAAAALAIGVLYMGGGYWAIVASSVGSSAFTVVISYAIAPYRPAFGLRALSDFRSFIGWFSSAQLISALNWQLDRVMLGHLIPRSTLGQYTMAGDIAAMPTQSLIGPAMQPVMAAFSRIHDDFDRLRGAYLKASRFAMFLAVPAALGMALTADLIVAVLIGPKWAEAAVYLRWLSLTIVLNAYVQPLASLSLAVNRPATIFRLNAIELAVRAAAIPLGYYLFSVLGIIAARGAISVLMFTFSMVCARGLIGIGLRPQLLNLRKIAVAATTMSVVVLLLRHELAGFGLHELPELIFSASLGALIYMGVLFAYGARPNAREDGLG